MDGKKIVYLDGDKNIKSFIIIESILIYQSYKWLNNDYLLVK